jgi:hypothetical protein
MDSELKALVGTVERRGREGRMAQDRACEHCRTTDRLVAETATQLEKGRSVLRRRSLRRDEPAASASMA